MAAMMIITNQNLRIRKTIYTSIGFPKDIREGSGESAKIADSGRKGVIACEQSTI